jgi:hypothetical protein
LIYFRHKPDPVFTAILHAALERELAKVAALRARHDLDAWEACYPHVSRRFTIQSVIPALERLSGASQAMAVYRITESQWLLLYECLANYCAELNDVAPGQPDGLLPVGDYRLAEIDFDALVALYFWDTEFLAAPRETTPSEGLEGDTHGWRVDSDESRLEKVEDPAWDERGARQWFRPGSRRYPDWDEGADF